MKSRKVAIPVKNRKKARKSKLVTVYGGYENPHLGSEDGARQAYDPYHPLVEEPSKILQTLSELNPFADLIGGTLRDSQEFTSALLRLGRGARSKLREISPLGGKGSTRLGGREYTSKAFKTSLVLNATRVSDACAKSLGRYFTQELDENEKTVRSRISDLIGNCADLAFLLVRKGIRLNEVPPKFDAFMKLMELTKLSRGQGKPAVKRRPRIKRPKKRKIIREAAKQEKRPSPLGRKPGLTVN